MDKLSMIEISVAYSEDEIPWHFAYCTTKEQAIQIINELEDEIE